MAFRAKSYALTVPVKPTNSLVPSSVSSQPAKCVDLFALSQATGVPVKVLRTFAAIRDPANRTLFTAEAAVVAFARVKSRRVTE